MRSDSRPYLTERRCGRCLVALELEERREGGWLFITYKCPCCLFSQVVKFSLAELEEWARRGHAGAGPIDTGLQCGYNVLS